MTILYNSDNHTTATQGLRANFDSFIEGELDRFGSQISKVHVYLSDVNSKKDAPNDKQITLEVQVDGIKNVAATANGDNFEIALRNCIDKLSNSLDSLLSKHRDPKGPDISEMQ
jgi:hypothetical protein